MSGVQLENFIEGEFLLAFLALIDFAARVVDEFNTLKALLLTLVRSEGPAAGVYANLSFHIFQFLKNIDCDKTHASVNVQS